MEKPTLDTSIRQLFVDYLLKNNHKQTRERYAILEFVYQMVGHFDVDMLYVYMLDKNNFHISKATLYNTIELLVNARLIVRHQFGSAAAKYETMEQAQTHAHLVCTYCGSVREYKNEKSMRILENSKIPKFSPEYYSLYIHGICSKCKYARNKKK